MVKALLVLGADVNALNATQASARHLAAKITATGARVGIVRALALCGAERCPPNHTGCTYACQSTEAVTEPIISTTTTAAQSDSNNLQSPDPEIRPRTSSFVLGAVLQSPATSSSMSAAMMAAAIDHIERNLHQKPVEEPAALGEGGDGATADDDAAAAEKSAAPVEPKPKFPKDVKRDLHAFKQSALVRSAMQRLARQRESLDASNQSPSADDAAVEHFSILLALDGGGIRGLITVQLLIALEQMLGDRLFDYVDWAAGTSTGAYITGGLARGWSLRDAQRLYLRLKDQLFEGWARPYNSDVLDEFLKQELGAETTMADLDARVVMTAVVADHAPVELHLFRSYQLPLLGGEVNAEMNYARPEEVVYQFFLNSTVSEFQVKLWHALRCSSAAPTYFSSVDGKYVDGALMANNPTMVLMQQVYEYRHMIDWALAAPNRNAAKIKEADAASAAESANGGGDGEEAAKSPVEKPQIGCVISIGCGQIPIVPVASLDMSVSEKWLLARSASISSSPATRSPRPCPS